MKLEEQQDGAGGSADLWSEKIRENLIKLGYARPVAFRISTPLYVFNKKEGNMRTYQTNDFVIGLPDDIPTLGSIPLERSGQRPGEIET